MSEQRTYQANAVAHFDISGPDDEALRSFYGDLLGWRLNPQGPGYALVETPGGLDGAIVGAEQPSVTLGVVVTDIERTVREAADLGGGVIMPPTDNGWV